MTSLTDISRARRILCIGAHSDDLEIGCGGTVLRLLRERPGQVTVTWCVFAADGVRGEEARAGAARVLAGAADARLVLHAFRDAHMPGQWLDVKAAMGAIRDGLRDVPPDLIFTHRPDDAHQDHRLLAELTAQAFRDHAILGYEIPKYDGDLGQPNVFAPIAREDLDGKCAALEAFASQRGKHWFDEETFRGLARLRGLECASPTRYAEGFYCRKWVL